MNCPICEQEGKPRESYHVLMRYTPLFREDGTYRYHDPALPVDYECQSGHHWKGPEDTSWDAVIDQQAGLYQAEHEKIERLKAEHATMRSLLKRMLPDAFWVVQGGDAACVFCGARLRSEEPFNAANLKHAFSQVQHTLICPIVQAQALLAD